MIWFCFNLYNTNTMNTVVTIVIVIPLIDWTNSQNDVGAWTFSLSPFNEHRYCFYVVKPTLPLKCVKIIPIEKDKLLAIDQLIWYAKGNTNYTYIIPMTFLLWKYFVLLLYRYYNIIILYIKL